MGRAGAPGVLPGVLYGQGDGRSCPKCEPGHFEEALFFQVSFLPPYQETRLPNGIFRRSLLGAKSAADLFSPNYCVSKKSYSIYRVTFVLLEQLAFKMSYFFVVDSLRVNTQFSL